MAALFKVWWTQDPGKAGYATAGGNVHYEITGRIPTVEEYQALRESVGWHNHSVEVVERSLKNSLCSVCALAGKQVVAFGRVVGDGVLHFYLRYVIVLPEYQGKGIGYTMT